MLAVLACCWLTGVAVNNLGGTRAALVIDTIFPRLGQNPLDTISIGSAWDVVQQEYVIREVPGTVGTQGAEGGVIEALRERYSDRFSAFYTAGEYAMLQRDLSGRRNGSIGITLEARCDGATICPPTATPTVVAIEDVLKGQPADRAGLRNGDILVSVGDRSVASLAPDIAGRINAVGPLIRGAAGTSVRLVVQRGTRQLTLTITRANLQIPSAYAQRIGGVLYLEVTAFDENTGESVRSLLQDGLRGGVDGIVLDLRQNPGGLVTEAQSTASEFLTPRSGEQDVVVRRGRLAPNESPQTAQNVQRDRIESGGLAPATPLVVLIDGGSASAAEIVAAALHDDHRATLVGQKSFGKGSVQQDFGLPDGSDLHLTVEKWFGPAGESIDGTGITPDVVVGLPDADHRFHLDAQSPAASADAQLQAALAALARG